MPVTGLGTLEICTVIDLEKLERTFCRSKKKANVVKLQSKNKKVQTVLSARCRTTEKGFPCPIWLFFEALYCWKQYLND